MPGPGLEPGLLRPQPGVLTTRRSRRATEEVDTLLIRIYYVFRLNYQLPPSQSFFFAKWGGAGPAHFVVLRRGRGDFIRLSVRLESYLKNTDS